MTTKILVAYAGKYGSTAEIAEKIAETLRRSGLPTDVLPVKQADDLTPYQAVLCGSGVYMGQWRKEAAAFLKIHEDALAERRVWMFSSGPTDKGDPVELTKGWRFPKRLQPLADRIKPEGIVVFHGKLDENELSAFEKWVIKKVKAPLGDFREWDAITSWANGVADALKNKPPDKVTEPES